MPAHQQDLCILTRRVPEGLDVLTCKEVAHILDIHPSTVRDMYDSGQLQGYSMNATGDVEDYANRRIFRESLIAWMIKHTNYDSQSLMADLNAIGKRLSRAQAEALITTLKRHHKL